VIWDFLQTKLSKAELKSALDVLREFKEGESNEEWLMVPFAAWAKLEQLEEYLEFLVEGKELKEDTKEVLKQAGITVQPK
jgi:hypothetical protein